MNVMILVVIDNSLGKQYQVYMSSALLRQFHRHLPPVALGFLGPSAEPRAVYLGAQVAGCDDFENRGVVHPENCPRGCRISAVCHSVIVCKEIWVRELSYRSATLFSNH